MDSHREHFVSLPAVRQKTRTAHQIGGTIAAKHVSLNRSELHSGTNQGFGDLIESDKYSQRSSFYILSPTTAIEIMLGRYGADIAKKIHTDDKVRIAGILIMDSEMREFLPDLTGRSRGGSRQSLDASRPRRSAGLIMLHHKFIDEEVTITLPNRWNSQGCIERINSLMGDDVFSEHGTFNPNNLQHMRMAWMEKEVTSIFTRLEKEYCNAMDKWTCGTGGGSGAAENFVGWDEADETGVVMYTGQGGQPSLVYLSCVHMWDREFGYPFVSVRDPLPTDCAIDDCLNFFCSDDMSDSMTTTPTPILARVQNLALKRRKHAYR